MFNSIYYINILKYAMESLGLKPDRIEYFGTKCFPLEKWRVKSTLNGNLFFLLYKNGDFRLFFPEYENPTNWEYIYETKITSENTCKEIQKIIRLMAINSPAFLENHIK